MKTQTFIGAVSGLFIAGLGVAKEDVINFVSGGLLISHAVAVTRKKDTETAHIQPVTRVYIDGANTLGASDFLNFKIDFTAFAQYIAHGQENVIFNYYFAVADNPTADQNNFIKYLQRNGYNVIESLKKQLPQGNYKNKGDDVQIATDIAINANKNDHIILVSGDGDFTYSLEQVKAKGCQVSVISTAQCLSQQLKNVADNVIDLAELQPDIQRHHKPNKFPSKSPTMNYPVLL
ncbi:NYN domain-containing protein [Geminocystis sp. CENA526]|uniref:LabA-like NYN domain-containing protein n=1 Tax=Geminocystis sp. CENA526 TaxID=1355871 RepID=UPI003D6FD3FF